LEIKFNHKIEVGFGGRYQIEANVRFWL